MSFATPAAAYFRTSSTACHIALLLTMLCSLTAACAADEPPVLVQELGPDNWDQLVPTGKEVDAIYGDFVLQNRHLRAVIARPVASRNANMTVRTVAGALIDLTVRAHQSDQLSAYYPARRRHAFSEFTLQDPGQTQNGTAAVIVSAPGNDTLPACQATWSLGPDDLFLQLTTTWTNTSEKTQTVSLSDDLRADGGKEIMFRAADGVQPAFWFHDVFWQQAVGIRAPQHTVRVKGSARESVLTFERNDTDSVTLAPGEQTSLTRQLFVNRDLPELFADMETTDGKAAELQQLTLHVHAAGRPIADARVQLTFAEQNRGTVVTSAAGSVTVRLPKLPGTAQVSIAGSDFAAQPIAIDADQLIIHQDDYQAGTAVIRIVDEQERPLPAKVEFIGRAPAPTPDWGPETAEHRVKNLAYTPNGLVRQELAAGTYELIVSRGPEYHAEFTTLQVLAGQTTERTISLPRLLQTPGWISADFHSHSSPSGDNTGSQLGRVLNLAAEHLEFAPCTEHNRVSTYTHHLRDLQLEAFVATVSGMELTGSPLPLNHQNVFPMVHRPRTQDGGGPVTDVSPEAQIERLAAWDSNSEKLIQQNHPDIGWLFYDKDGNQQPDGGYSRSFPLIHVMEIHPIDRLLNPSAFQMEDGKPRNNHTALNWLQLLNQGFRIWGVVNSDSHYNFHGSGGLRIWVRSSTDDPAAISSDEIRDASRNGHVIMSNGPYLEATFGESGSRALQAIAGDDLHAASGRVQAHIRVQCANWLDVDTVKVLVNGRASDELTFTRQKTPQLFSNNTVKFEHKLEISLPHDAHLIVLTGHSAQKLGPVTGPGWGGQAPAALSNPVFVDVDGDGFRASRDTLDAPLPVKFLAP